MCTLYYIYIVWIILRECWPNHTWLLVNCYLFHFEFLIFNFCSTDVRLLHCEKIETCKMSVCIVAMTNVFCLVLSLISVKSKYIFIYTFAKKNAQKSPQQQNYMHNKVCWTNCAFNVHHKTCRLEHRLIVLHIVCFFDDEIYSKSWMETKPNLNTANKQTIHIQICTYATHTHTYMLNGIFTLQKHKHNRSSSVDWENWG